VTITRTIRTLRDALHLLVGMPSYETYRAHMAEAHPDRQQARYGGRNGGRCC
jgi:uncharacterized short protein YbdD (DUF466 family)